jgi:hypothetical protein
LAQVTIHVIAVARAQGLALIGQRNRVVVGIGEEVFTGGCTDAGAAGGEALAQLGLVNARRQ